MAPPNDEVNLLDVFRSIGGIFTKIFSFIYKLVLNCISIFLKNVFLILSFLILGLAGGYFHFRNTTPVFSSDIILSSNYLPNDLCAEIVNGLQWHVEDNSPDLLAKELGISIESAAAIVDIEFRNNDDRLLEKYEDKDTIVLGIPFRIKILSTNNNIFDELHTALVNYFDKNPNVIMLKNIRQTHTKLMMNKIQQQIIDLDSLKKLVANSIAPRGSQTGFVFGEPIDPLNIYRESIELYADELQKNADLIITAKNINVIRDFEIRGKPVSPKLKKSLATYGFLGIVLGFLISYCRTLFKK